MLQVIPIYTVSTIDKEHNLWRSVRHWEICFRKCCYQPWSTSWSGTLWLTFSDKLCRVSAPRTTCVQSIICCPSHRVWTISLQSHLWNSTHRQPWVVELTPCRHDVVISTVLLAPWWVGLKYNQDFKYLWLFEGRKQVHVSAPDIIPLHSSEFSTFLNYIILYEIIIVGVMLYSSYHVFCVIHCRIRGRALTLSLNRYLMTPYMPAWVR